MIFFQISQVLISKAQPFEPLRFQQIRSFGGWDCSQAGSLLEEVLHAILEDSWVAPRKSPQKGIWFVLLLVPYAVCLCNHDSIWQVLSMENRTRGSARATSALVEFVWRARQKAATCKSSRVEACNAQSQTCYMSDIGIQMIINVTCI